MKILHLMPYVPVPPDFGGALRVFHLLRNMARRHEVTVLTYGAPSDAARLQQQVPGLTEAVVIPPPWTHRHKRLAQLVSTFGTRSYFTMACTSPRMQRAIDAAVARTAFDIIQTEFSHFTQFRLPDGPLKIVDAHNVEYDNFRRMWANAKGWSVRTMHYRLEHLKLRREEIDGCRRQDALLVTSERDAGVFRQDLPDLPSAVVPNGVDASYFTPCSGPPEPSTIVFTGMMGYVPNYDGMLYFLDEIFPRIQATVPDARLLIVGKQPPAQLQARAGGPVTITGYVDDVRPYIRRACVYVVPLRMGSGTRLKIAEALAMRVPIVTTSIGCEGIDVEHGTSALIADDPKEFADQVVRLLHDAALRSRLTQNGYDLMQRNYEWSVIGDRLDAAYAGFAAARNRRTEGPLPQGRGIHHDTDVKAR